MLTSTEYLCNLCALKFMSVRRDSKRLAQDTATPPREGFVAQAVRSVAKFFYWTKCERWAGGGDDRRGKPASAGAWRVTGFPAPGARCRWWRALEHSGSEYHQPPSRCLRAPSALRPASSRCCWRLLVAQVNAQRDVFASVLGMVEALATDALLGPCALPENRSPVIRCLPGSGRR